MPVRRVCAVGLRLRAAGWTGCEAPKYLGGRDHDHDRLEREAEHGTAFRRQQTRPRCNPGRRSVNNDAQIPPPPRPLSRRASSREEDILIAGTRLQAGTSGCTAGTV